MKTLSCGRYTTEVFTPTIQIMNRATALADTVRQARAYLRRNGKRLPVEVVAQLKADLERNERQLEQLMAKK